MLAKILGVIWILAGLFWVVRLDCLKGWLKNRTNKRIRLIRLGIVLVAGIMLIGSVFRVPGILPKLVLIIGLVISIKAIKLITSKASEGMTGWWEDRSLIFFRLWAVCVLGIGVMVFLV